jgi:hypothetical protein
VTAELAHVISLLDGRQGNRNKGFVSHVIRTVHIPTINTGHTQMNGAVLLVFTIKTAPLFCVCPLHQQVYALNKIHSEV